MRLLALLLAAGALSFACAPATGEDELRARIRALRTDGKLPVEVVTDPPEVLAFFERFHAITAGLDENPPELGDRAALDAFQRDAARLVRLEVCQQALRTGAPLARPLVRIPSPPAAALVDTPKLLELRNWTQLLCARSKLAGAQGDGRAAIDSLVTALRLLSVLDDGSLIGEVVCSSQEQTVLATLEEIAALHAVDAGALREAVDPYLRAHGHAELSETVALETGYFLRAVESVLQNEVELSPADMEVFGFAGVGFVDGANQLIDRFEDIRAMEEPCHARLGNSDEELDQGPRLLYAVREWHSRNIRLELARVALAVVAHGEEHGAWPESLAELEGSFEDGLPVHPCQHLRFEYERTETEFRLTSVDRRHPERDATRAAYTWPLGSGRQ